MLASSAALSRRERARRERGKIAQDDAGSAAIDGALELVPELEGIYLEAAEGLEAEPFAILYDAEDDVLGENLLGAGSLRLFLGDDGEDALCARGQSLEHLSSSASISTPSTKAFRKEARSASTSFSLAGASMPKAKDIEPGPKAQTTPPRSAAREGRASRFSIPESAASLSDEMRPEASSSPMRRQRSRIPSALPAASRMASGSLLSISTLVRRSAATAFLAADSKTATSSSGFSAEAPVAMSSKREPIDAPSSEYEPRTWMLSAMSALKSLS